LKKEKKITRRLSTAKRTKGPGKGCEAPQNE